MTSRHRLAPNLVPGILHRGINACSYEIVVYPTSKSKIIFKAKEELAGTKHACEQIARMKAAAKEQNKQQNEKESK